MHPTLSAPARRHLALAILLALPLSPAWAVDAPSCPAGTLKCPKKPVDWGMCGKNDLLDFYVAGLPTTGDRSAAPRDASALKVSTTDKNHYVLEGKAEIRQLDLFLHAEKITYDAETTDFTAAGPVTYQDRGLLLSAANAKGNTDLDQCTLDGVRYQLLQSRGNGVAEVAVIDDVDHARLTRATYSTCNLRDQQWAFAARDLDLDRAEGIGRAHDVTFRVHNVPVFWLPYLRFPLDDRRVSGLLYPTIGYGERRGLDFALPYYFNIAPNYDATVTPRIMTERGLMLGGEFRYLTDGSSGTFSADFLAHDNRAADESLEVGDEVPGRRWWYQWKDTTTFNANWGANVNLNRVSDDRYFEDFGRGLYSSAIGFLPSSAYVNGHGSWWTASIGGDQYQITDPTLPSQYEPYRRLPRMTFSGQHGLAGLLEGGVDAEAVAFSKDHALDGRRVDLYPHLDLPLESAAWFVRPELGYRWTSYSLDHLDEGDDPLLRDRHPNRGVPIFSVDSGLVFERSLDIGGEAYTQTFEPRAYYLRVPYRNQDDLPVFDTQEVPFSFSQLFRSNRFVGADRQMDANNLSLALTTRFLEDASGVERLSASIGQIHYFDEQRVQLPTAGGVPRPPTDYDGSIYAGEIDLHLNDRWRIVLDQQWDPNAHRTELSTFTLQNRFGDDGIVNFSYRYRRDFLEQVDVSAAIPLTPAWRLIARENYALNDPLASANDPRGRDGRTLERFIGIEHDTCCVAWRVIARHWIRSASGEADNAIYFELEFKGVGSIGQQTDSFLRRGILGYQ
ncbi:LPS-assembly protein LptD [Dokdonella fugitiva]|uniref:LPS-assembly protein LptD n=1 Tax=Dokdonella fugitiva TaxID=328517 RepID=UPI0015FD1643|nr:LPS assembly protein LptD [Dokdonella fugitiva]MBA8885000.1 LPS-assembly protein [Dokdonella fugitiva]